MASKPTRSELARRAVEHHMKLVVQSVKSFDAALEGNEPNNVISALHNNSVATFERYLEARYEFSHACAAARSKAS
jgi:hypothetical protein